MFLTIKEVWADLFNNTKHDCLDDRNTKGNTILSQGSDLELNLVKCFRVFCLQTSNHEHCKPKIDKEQGHTNIRGRPRGSRTTLRHFSDSTALSTLALQPFLWGWSNHFHTVLRVKPRKRATPAAVALRCVMIPPGDQSFQIAASAMSGQRSGPNQYFAGALIRMGAVPEASCFLVALLSGISMTLSDRIGRVV